VRLLRILPQRWQRLVPEMTKFGVIGVINTAIDMAIYNALLSIGPIKASAVSMTVATTSSYLMNRYWTFARRQRSSAPREYVLFFALNLVGFVIQSTPIAFAKYGMHFSEDGTIVDLLAFNIAKIVGIGMGMLFRFWSYRTFVFKAPVEGAAVTADAAALRDGGGACCATTDEEFAELAEQLEPEFELAEQLEPEFDAQDSDLLNDTPLLPGEPSRFRR